MGIFKRSGKRGIEEAYPDPWHTVPENDTWDKIEDDATMPPFAYCLEYDLCDDCGDESDRIQDMCQHIALRAFKLGVNHGRRLNHGLRYYGTHAPKIGGTE